MYRQYIYIYIYDLLFNYNIIIKVNEYLKLKLPKMNLKSQYIHIFNIFRKLKVKKINTKKNNDGAIM